MQRVAQLADNADILSGHVPRGCGGYLPCGTGVIRGRLPPAVVEPLPPSAGPSPYHAKGLDPLTLLTDDGCGLLEQPGAPQRPDVHETPPSCAARSAGPSSMDAQLQGIKWIKSKYGSELKAIRLGQKRCAATEAGGVGLQRWWPSPLARPEVCEAHTEPFTC